MSKYSGKIKAITTLVHLSDIQTALNHKELQTHNQYVKFLKRISTATQANKLDFYQEEEISLQALHSQTDPPFAALIHSYVNHDSDFNTFVAWYRQDQSFLTTPSYFGTSPEVKKIHDIMYNQTGARKRLHDLLYKNHFISLDVQHYAESVNLIYRRYKINNIDTLHLFIQQDDTFVELEELCNVLASMHKLVSQKTKPVILTILYCPQKKLVTWKNFSIFCTDNVNSGMTLPNEYVCCWRKEELLKVVTHELVHFFMLDYASTASLNIGKIAGTDYINEAYTETLATVIRSVMLSQSTNREFIDIFAEEIIFSLFQTAKIITLSGGTTWKDFAENKIVIKQTTSVRSYFIIKTMIMCNITDFITWLGKELILPSEEKYVAFLHKVFANFNENTFIINAINTFCKLLSCMTENEQKRFVISTSRMTAH